MVERCGTASILSSSVVEDAKSRDGKVSVCPIELDGRVSPSDTLSATLRHVGGKIESRFSSIAEDWGNKGAKCPHFIPTEEDVAKGTLN
jgi:hypothetical protein